MSFLILKHALKNFWAEHAFEASASIAFFAFFAFFPILLILVSTSSFILKSMHIQAQLIEAIVALFPSISRLMIKQNITNILDSSGTFGIVGIITLLWAASSVFSSLLNNLNRAWHTAANHNNLKTRGIGMLLVSCFVIILSLFFVAKATIHLLPIWGFAPKLDTYVWTFIQLLSNYILYILIYISFVFLYFLTPTAKVKFYEAVIAAIFAAVGSGIATNVFSWYLGSGLSKINIIYGSLGMVVILLAWIYIISLIVLFGAHLCSSIAYNLSLYKINKQFAVRF